MLSTSSICCSHNSILNFISSCNQEFTFEKSKERQKYIFLQPPHLVLHVGLLQLLLIKQPTKLGELLTQQLDLRTPQWREKVGLESTWTRIYMGGKRDVWKNLECSEVVGTSGAVCASCSSARLPSASLTCRFTASKCPNLPTDFNLDVDLNVCLDLT